MHTHPFVRAGILLAVAALMLPSAALAGPSFAHAPAVRGPSSSAPAPLPSAPPAADASTVTVAARVHALESTLLARGVPARDIHPPDFAAEAPGRSGPVAPTYSQGPAPMGIADLGLRNSSGAIVPYVYDTSSVWGSVTLNRTQSAYVDGDGPDTFGIQLNAVAANVELYGVPGFQFWAQDYVSYTSSTGALSFGDNVWNFSSPNASLLANVFASYGPGGSPQPPIYYYAVGPTVTVAYPFTVSLYLNTSSTGGDQAIFFNYSVTAPNGTFHGSFDEVVFHSSTTVSGTPPALTFQVNGTGVGPSGLPNDVELVLVGNDLGDTTTFFVINATMELRFWNATSSAYETVPAAYDAGSDTGETSNGVLPVYRTATVLGPPSVTLVTGPSFVDGLWNVSTTLWGSRHFVVTQRPQNAFLFVSPGTVFDNATAQWVPTIRLFGATTSDFSIPNDGAYTLEWLLSDRTPIGLTVPALTLPNTTAALHETLAVNTTLGSYTPLLAWGNGEIAAISQGTGNGTAGNPYVLIHRPVGSLDPVFGQLNDFGFPVFAGVLLINTTAYVNVIQPAVGLDYGSWMAAQLADLGTPAANALQLEFWNVSNVVVVNSTDLTGWLSSNFGFFPAGEVLFWGSSGNLVARDTFHDQGVAIALYGGTNNTVWGNTILAASVEPSFYYGNNTTGILEWESGDLLYNNYVSVPQPALTPTSDAVSCQITCVRATYTDTWNVPEEPANASLTLLGQVLTGSILHTWYQGGNFWSNYGSPSDPFGVLPYNDAGQITVGGDYVPLTVSTLYSVTFVETGLASALPWNVTALGLTSTSTTDEVVVSAPNGTYGYAVDGPAGYVGPAAGSFDVHGANLTVSVAFLELFAVQVDESGLVSGWSWTVTFNLTASPTTTVAVVDSSGTVASTALVNGSYTFAVSAEGYTVVPDGGTVMVAGQPVVETVHFTLAPILTVTASGLAPGTPWTVTVTQGASTSNLTYVGDGKLVFTVLEVSPGPFTWTVSAVNYTATPAGGSGTSPTPTTEGVAFLPKTTSAAPGVDWSIVAIGALAALAVLGFALYFVERRRVRRAPKPVVPVAPAAAAGPATAAGPAPWEEGPSDEERPPSYTRRPGSP